MIVSSIWKFLLPLGSLALALAEGQAAEPPSDVVDFTEQYCVSCHGPDKQKGDFRIDQLAWDLGAIDSRENWELVHDYILEGDMPPEEAKKHPKSGDRQTFLSALEEAFAQADREAKPGGTPLRRLNRVEYLNTVRDLFELPEIKLPLSFPEDATSAEFDTMPEGLYLSPAVMEAYHETATNIANLVAPLPRQPSYQASYGVTEIGGDVIRRWFGPKLKKLEGRFWDRYEKRDYLMFTGFNNSGWTGALWDALFLAPASGVYRVRLLANAQAEGGADGKPLRLGFYTFDPADNPLPKRYRREWAKRVAEVEVPAGEPTWIDCLVPVEAGRTFHIYCENRFSDGKFPADNVAVGKNVINVWVRKAMADPAPTVELRGMEVEGLVDVAPRVRDFFESWPPKLSQYELESKLIPLASRAFRRPLSDNEKENLIDAVLEHGNESGSPEFAWHYAIRRILCSTEFLYREADETDILDDFALASRLSYFLWSSMPDEKLFELAESGSLSDPYVLELQIQRTLNNPKSQRFVKHFAGQWLGNRTVANINVCDIRYQWDENVRYGFLRSTERFFEEVLRENLPIATFIDSDFTYANTAMLAAWGVEGAATLADVAARQRHSQIWAEPERFSLDKLPAGMPVHVRDRGGVLGLPGVLTVTGDGVESSPILRGVWVLEKLFGEHPPPPPKDVPALDIDTSQATSVRETLKAHTELETCAKCHRDIDPLGLALENYDAIGGWRTEYVGASGSIIDATSTMPDGTQLDGAASIKKHLLENREIFTRNLLTKLLEYGAGRKLSVGDRRVVDEIVANEPSEGYRFQDLIIAAINSDVFRAK